MEKAKSFLVFVAQSLVDNQDAVRVDEKTDDMGILLTLHVAAGDMGKVIGREGATAKAIRTLLRAVGMSEKARVNLKIEEPADGQRFNEPSSY